MQDALRRLAQIPDESEFFQDLEDVVGHVDLPPEKALVGARHVVVMVVVPAFAHGHEREPEVVTARVFRGVATTSPDVRERIDGERRMQKEARGHEVPPQASLEPKQNRAGNSERPWADEMVFLEPTYFGVGGKVRDHVEARAFVFAPEPPTEMRVPKSTSGRTVQITLGVGMFVVQPMRSSPPERSFLRRRRTEERQDQLKDATRLVRSMREVTVIDARDCKHAQEVRPCSDEHELPRDLVQNRKHRDHVHHDEGDEVVPLFFG